MQKNWWGQAIQPGGCNGGVCTRNCHKGVFAFKLSTLQTNIESKIGMTQPVCDAAAGDQQPQTNLPNCCFRSGQAKHGRLLSKHEKGAKVVLPGKGD